MKEKIIELYKQYLQLCAKDKEIYFPDSFIQLIHSDYLDNNVIQLPHPIYATWGITEKCNLNCIFCSASSKCHKGSINNPNVQLIVDKLIETGVICVSIKGGEPSIVKQLPDAIHKLVSNGIFVELTTNGTGLTDEFFKKIDGCNRNKLKIKISLDSPQKDLNDIIRGNGSFTNATNAMDNCVRYGWDFRLLMVVINSNKNQIVDMYKFANEKSATSFGINLVLPLGRGRKLEKVDIDENILQQVIYIHTHQDKTKFQKFALGLDDYRFFEYIYGGNNYSDQYAKKISLIKCNGAKTTIDIEENGDCYPCGLMRYPEFKMGNLLQDDFTIIWNSPIAHKFNEIHRYTKSKCKTCQFTNCNTGCLALNYSSKKGLIDQVPNCEL